MSPSNIGRSRPAHPPAKLFLYWLLFIFFAAAAPCAARAVQVPLTVQNREAAVKIADPISSGVPFAEGIVQSTAELRLTEEGAEIPAQFMITARWPDGSARWVLVDFQSSFSAGQSKQFVLETDTTAQPVTGVSIFDGGGSFTINTGAREFTVNKSDPFIYGRAFQVVVAGAAYRAIPAPGSWMIEEQGPLKVILRTEGNWYAGSSLLRDSLIRFRSRFVFYRNKPEVRCYLSFRNNNALPWGLELPPGPSPLMVSSAAFGVPLLTPGTYPFGAGIEKTWEVVASESSALVIDSRYLGNGALDSRYTPPRLLAAASPDYYAQTGAWGTIAPRPVIADPVLQADVDLFERLQRAKVIAADVQDPPGLTGITLWGHLAGDIENWNHYGGLRWGGGFGPVSDNHYDWVYGMYLQFMRTGLLPFADAGRVFAKHEIDFALYHTTADSSAFNYQKNWESRPTNNGPDNEFGGGRPSHTWLQGYALHWLLTGDPRGKDAYEELAEGLRQYVYESFNGEGYLRTRELRVPGWITDNLIALWRIDPNRAFATSAYGTKTIPQAIKDVLQSVFDFEHADGGGGFVYAGGEAEADPNRRQPLMNCYFLEPAIKAYDEVFYERDSGYASSLLALITRMTGWLMSVTYGGAMNSAGEYLPRQIPYMVDITRSEQNEGQIPYLLMAANAAGFLYSRTRDSRYSAYSRAAFQDYVRYLGVAGGDQYIDASQRTPAAYNSAVYVDTESKIHGWSNRYGQYYLASEHVVLDDSNPRQFVLWNGFLQMLNILELTNNGSSDVGVVITVHNKEGNRAGQRAVTVPADGQFDVIVNDLAGFQTDSYGIITLSYDGEAISGRLTVYRPAAEADNFDFAFAAPFMPPLNGVSGVPFNTYHPRLGIPAAGEQVLNWLTIVNLDRTAAHSFTVGTHDQTGALLNTRAFSVPAFGRTDIAAGHELRPDVVGYQEIVPAGDALYLAQLTRYGARSNGYDFAVMLPAAAPGGGDLWLPVSNGADGDNWVEIVNSAETRAEALVRIYDNSGRAAETAVQIAPKAQLHISAAPHLETGSSGAALLRLPPDSRVLARSMFYFRRPDGSVAAAYTSPIQPSGGGNISRSYNLFLGMYNWLRLFNRTADSRTVQIRVFSAAGVHEQSLLFGPYSGLDLGLHESRFGTRADSYGRVELSDGSMLAEVIRVRSQPAEPAAIDFVFPTH